MLKPICDQRSGTRLELVLMTFNEQERIRRIISQYGADVDIVILDGGSTDNTREIVRQHGGTVFERVGENIGENHFSYYVNAECRSGTCFYMMCDEYIEPADLQRVANFLQQGEGQVYGRRIDWFYGTQARKPTCLTPKGFRRGDAAYDAADFHNSLTFKNPSPRTLVVDVQHLHIFSMKDDYGKYGHYIYHEVRELRTSRKPYWAAFMRVLRLGRALQLSVVRFPSHLWLILFFVAQFFATAFLFLMSYIEQRGLMPKDEQLRSYLGKYRDPVPSPGRPADQVRAS